MKLTINKAMIENGIKQVIPFVNKKETSVISNIKLEVKNNSLIMTGTDYMIGCEVVISNIDNGNDGFCIVKGDNLLKSITRLKNDDVIIELNNDILTIKQGRSRAKLECSSDEFPSLNIDIESMQKIDIDIMDLNNGFNSVMAGIDISNPKVELSGVLIKICNSDMDIVSTDTKRLIVNSFKTNIPDDRSIIIPKKIIAEMQKVINESTVLYVDDVNIVIKNNNLIMTSKLINGKYPEYTRVIPKEFKNSFNLDKNKMIESIKFVTSIESKIEMFITKNEIKISSLDSNNTIETYIENLDLDIKEDIYIRLNSTYLIDFLNSIYSDEFEININEPKNPIVVKENSLITVIMPLMD